MGFMGTYSRKSQRKIKSLKDILLDSDKIMAFYKGNNKSQNFTIGFSFNYSKINNSKKNIVTYICDSFIFYE